MKRAARSSRSRRPVLEITTGPAEPARLDPAEVAAVMKALVLSLSRLDTRAAVMTRHARQHPQDMEAVRGFLDAVRCARACQDADEAAAYGALAGERMGELTQLMLMRELMRERAARAAGERSRQAGERGAAERLEYEAKLAAGKSPKAACIEMLEAEGIKFLGDENSARHLATLKRRLRRHKRRTL